MVANQVHNPPIRVADLIAFKKQGKNVTCDIEFGIHQVEFRDRDAPYDAYLFFSYFSGKIDGQDYKFRKCYARGCPNNLCPHVAQAVMIANRYLQRDQAALAQAGIQVPELLFSLPEMMVSFQNAAQAQVKGEDLDHFLALAKEGEKVAIQVEPEFMPAHENFEGRKEAQVFLIANFSISHQGCTSDLQRCFSCFPVQEEGAKKPLALSLARQRMSELYQQFERSGVDYHPRFFD